MFYVKDITTQNFNYSGPGGTDSIIKLHTIAVYTDDILIVNQITYILGLHSEGTRHMIKLYFSMN